MKVIQIVRLTAVALAFAAMVTAHEVPDCDPDRAHELSGEDREFCALEWENLNGERAAARREIWRRIATDEPGSRQFFKQSVGTHKWSCQTGLTLYRVSDSNTGMAEFNGVTEAACVGGRGLKVEFWIRECFSDYRVDLYPDGSAFYYDFSRTKEGDGVEPSGRYRCTVARKPRKP